MALRVAFSDMTDATTLKFKDILRELYDDIEICADPDFLFCGTFGHEHLKYDCIKVLYTGEDAIPDFNLFDYGIGFAPISFGDRYLRFPLFYMYTDEYKKAEMKHIGVTQYLAGRKFCNFIYSNGNAALERDAFFELLSKYKKVDSGGKHRNNVGGPVKDILPFQMEYKFSIAFENSYSIGYSTEKILHAFAARTIPIYWGNPEIAKDFNNKAFINCHEYESFDEVVEKVIELDTDDDAYLRMLSQPIFEDNNKYNEEYNSLKQFVRQICDQDISKARRRGTGTWNRNYNEVINNMYLNEEKMQALSNTLYGKLLLKLLNFFEER